MGGDGAHWVKEGAELLGGIYQLDRFHLSRALNRVLDYSLATEVYQACTRGDVAYVESVLVAEQQRISTEHAKEVGRLRGYLLDNAFGLRDYRLVVNGEGLRGLGAIESNVDKLVANRMKKRGMSWTIKGAQKMARLISLREMGQLHSWITRKETYPHACTPKCLSAVSPRLWKAGVTARRHDQTVRKVSVGTKLPLKKDNSAWLAADLPALRGPHQDRPWVKILRALSHGVPSYPGDLPTNS